MNSILIATVGGSPDPIVTSIQTLRPDRVAFLCSARSKDTLLRHDDYKSIRDLPGVSLDDEWIAVVSHEDQIDECFETANVLIERLKRQFPGAVLKLDYTGGTKSMASGAVLAALRHGLQLYVTTGPRDNLKSVQAGEATSGAGMPRLLALEALSGELPRLFAAGEYRALAETIRGLLVTVNDSDIIVRLQQTRRVCEGLDAWDRFQYAEALEALRGFMKMDSIRSVVMDLKAVIGSLGKLPGGALHPEGVNGTGYEIVLDVLANARRRARAGRYDDAVSRLYRATELLEQARLWLAHGIDTSCCPVEKLPASLAESFKGQDEVKLGCQNGFELLASIDGDPVGLVYAKHRNHVKDALLARNESFLAHGVKPISRERYEQVVSRLEVFILEAVREATGKEPRLPEWPVDLAALQV